MDVNQDDIDKMLQGALVGGDSGPAASNDSEPDYSGVASQDDIDALFAAVGDSTPAASGEPTDAAEPVAAAEPEPTPEPAAVAEEPELDLSGVANQDDIDALFAAVGDPSPAGDTTSEAPATELSPVVEPEPPTESAAPVADLDIDLDGVADQNDIDALFSAVASAPEAASEPEPEPVPEPEVSAEPEAEPEMEMSEEAEDLVGGVSDSEADLDSLLSSISDASEEAGMPGSAEEGADPHTADANDLEELLRQVSEAAPPPPPPPSSNTAARQNPADTAILDHDISGDLVREPYEDAAEVAESDIDSIPDIDPNPGLEVDTLSSVQPEPPPAAAEAIPAAAPIAPIAPIAPAAAAYPAPPPAVAAHAGGTAQAPSAARREFSVLYGAGDVESVANQINSLLNSMSEKAHGYMQSWIAADSEAKELRTRALDEERRRTSLESEKQALSRQVDDLLSRIGELEGGKVATEESKRTLETSYQAKIRELESRLSMTTAEAETLKNELTSARNQATGVDIESRRVRFELDRLKSEVESERMERLRIQRALENREKEIQAMQAQAGGQASSLFIDELHRLVRRLETELDARSSGAHEALRQLDRLEVSEDMVPVTSNLRASLLQALGRDADPDDALKALGREASGIRGPEAVSPQKAEVLSFETALSTYNLTGAVDIAGTLLREATATPATLMRKVYQCPALRRPEVADRLVDLARLLEGLRTVQESSDRSRGVESGDSEVFHVHMFDYLHNLVRLKLINRMSGDIWRLFLDLRGRFSFVTSDKQWAEYRDNTLRDSSTKK